MSLSARGIGDQTSPFAPLASWLSLLDTLVQFNFQKLPKIHMENNVLGKYEFEKEFNIPLLQASIQGSQG